MITVLIAGILGFLISLTALPVFIKKMKSLKLGQLIREEGPATHQHKAGTPTMAGLIFIPAAILAYFLTLAVSALLFGTAPVPTATAWLTIAFTLGMLGVGAVRVLHPLVAQFTALIPSFLWPLAACLLLLDGALTLVLLRRTHSTDILCWYRRVSRLPLRDS